MNGENLKRPGDDDETQFTDQNMDDATRTLNMNKRLAVTKITDSTTPPDLSKMDQHAINSLIMDRLDQQSKFLTEQANSFNQIIQLFQSNSVTNTTNININQTVQEKENKPTENKIAIYIDNENGTIKDKDDFELLISDNFPDYNFIKIGPIKGGKQYVIELTDGYDVEKLKTKLSELHFECSNTNFDAKVDKRFLILKFNAKIKQVDLINKILSREKRTVFNADNTKLLKYKNEFNTVYAVLGYTGDAAKLIVQEPYHFVAGGRFELIPYTALSICTRCCGYHKSEQCKSAAIYCFRCDGNHDNLRRNCRAPPKCHNCAKANLADNHTALFMGCPSRIAKMKQLIETNGY